MKVDRREHTLSTGGEIPEGLISFHPVCTIFEKKRWGESLADYVSMKYMTQLLRITESIVELKTYRARSNRSEEVFLPVMESRAERRNARRTVSSK